MKKIFTFIGKILSNKQILKSSILIVILIYLIIAIWFSSVPEFPTLRTFNQDSLNDNNGPYTVHSIKKLIQDELDHSWLPNDFILSPTKVILDNRPNFQIGVLTIIRHSVRVLRDNLSRQRTTDEINKDIEKAFSFLNNDYERWVLPSFESRITKAISHLNAYNQDTIEAKNGANFYPRSDNLIQLFEQYISELGSLNNKLLSQEVSYFSIDDLFYTVQGTNYALYEIIHAIEKDFHIVLAEKRCTALLHETKLRLKQSNFDPTLVVKGNRGSLLANHLIQIAGITADVRQKLKSINVMLDKN